MKKLIISSNKFEDIVTQSFDPSQGCLGFRYMRLLTNQQTEACNVMNECTVSALTRFLAMLINIGLVT